MWSILLLMIHSLLPDCESYTVLHPNNSHVMFSAQDLFFSGCCPLRIIEKQFNIVSSCSPVNTKATAVMGAFIIIGSDL